MIEGTNRKAKKLVCGMRRKLGEINENPYFNCDRGDHVHRLRVLGHVVPPVTKQFKRGGMDSPEYDLQRYGYERIKSESHFRRI